MTEQEAITLFKCLSDRSRLQILKTLVAGDQYVELLAERLNLTPATISFHLKKLQEAGAVTSYKTQYYTMYRLEQALFRFQIMDVLQETSDDAAIQEEREAIYRQKVLDTFFSYGKLVSIPVQRKKERIILEELVKQFVPNQPYSEPEVNRILEAFHDDYCTLRRDLIGEKLMIRRDGIYFRLTKDTP